MIRRAGIGILILAAGSLALSLPLLAQTASPAADPDQLKKLDPAYQKANGCRAPESVAARDMPLIDGLAKAHFKVASATPAARARWTSSLASGAQWSR